jgi:hypothetical protein
MGYAYYHLIFIWKRVLPRPWGARKASSYILEMRCRDSEDWVVGWRREGDWDASTFLAGRRVAHFACLGRPMRKMGFWSLETGFRLKLDLIIIKICLAVLFVVDFLFSGTT